jgi:hypothetical protein
MIIRGALDNGDHDRDPVEGISCNTVILFRGDPQRTARGAIKHKYNIFPICAHAPLRASSAP